MKATRIKIALLVTCIMLTACSAPPAPSTPAAQPAPPPTPTTALQSIPTRAATAPTPTQAPAPPPTTPPTTTGRILPAPLYVLNRTGQLVRVAPDDLAITTVTSETETITGFDVSPTSGVLAYTVAPPNDGAPHRIFMAAPDGTERRELFSGALRTPLFLADDTMLRELDPSSQGHQIAYHIVEPLPDVEPQRQGPGIFVSLDLGMCPYLLVADQPEQGQNYEPLALSPDGMGLLLRVGEGETATMAVLPLAEMESVPIALTTSDGAALPCCAAIWSNDSTTLYATDGDTLWQVAASSGAATQVATAPNGALLHSFHQTSDGSLYAIATATEDTPRMTMYRWSPDKQWEALRNEQAYLLQGLWARDGSGALALVRNQTDAPARLLWLTPDTNPALPIPLDVPLSEGIMRWGYQE